MTAPDRQVTAHPLFTEGGTTVFEVMSGLAREHDAINLGQGFPDHGEPPEVIEAAIEATRSRSNQYPPMAGIPELRRAVAGHAARFHDLRVDPDSEVLVTNGATEALAAAILAFVRPGDEVVTLEPMYDSYAPMVRRAGGTVRPVRLQPPGWSIDTAALEAAFGPRTRAIILNNPMNPTGKVFDIEELSSIADLVVRHDAIIIADEVYEHLVFPPDRFHTMMTLPGLRDRVIRIGSAGKTFSLTGWKIGYITAAPRLMGPLGRCHQFLTFTAPPNLQYGIARGLGLEDSYFDDLRDRFRAKRDVLAAALTRAGLEVLPVQGTYFLVADVSGVANGADDMAFAIDLVRGARVAAVPLSPFYDSEPPRNLLRFCFAKRDEVLAEAARRLEHQFAGAEPAR